MRKKVLLGMSGGVDSSVSAILLQNQGYEVIGTTMILWQDNSKQAIIDAKKVCQKLNIEHHVIDLQTEFKNKVINSFICSYKHAKTPNPCVECNKYMKFRAFYKMAQDLGCDYIATGHYAKIKYSEEYKEYVLTKSNSKQKDQTYFLYGISKEILPKVIFPLSDFEDKTIIRKIAQDYDLDVAKKKDSQEVCFIPDNNYINFLHKNEKDISKKGDIVLSNGQILGNHNGLINYTIGQRKGLGISYSEPLYVIKLDETKNQVVVGTEKELYSKELIAEQLNFLLNLDLSKKINIEAKIRYRAKVASAVLEVKDNNAKVSFKEPQRAITPGQSVVFYINDIVLGGGKIKNLN